MLCKKIKHKSYQAAIKHITSMKETDKKLRKENIYGAYYHAACNAYHITSSVTITSKNKFVKFKG